MVEVLDRQVNAYERSLFVGSGYLWGEFRCPPEADLWHEPNQIGPWPVVVFGTAPVQITADGREPVVGTPNETLWYDADVSYRRTALGRVGDRSTFLALDPGLVDEIGPADGRDAASGPAVRQLRYDAEVLLRAHAIRAEAESPDPDLLALDVGALAVLAHLTSGSPVSVPVSRRSGPGRAVDRVRRQLAEDPAHDWTLTQLAEIVHYSPWFLCRVFRQLTGTTLSAYRQQLRLRASVDDALRAGANLSAIAQDYGFSSHSHYTRAFRVAFGCTPSAARSAGFRARMITGAGDHPRVG